jgi:hypothetical protein
MSEITEAADTIDRFLKEPAVQDALTAIRNDAYRAFMAARDDEGRRDAQAMGKAADKLETAFRAVVDAGERERLDEQSADRRLATR